MKEAAGTGFSAATRRISAADTAARDAEVRFGAPTATWARGADRLTGYGVAARLPFAGPDRLRDAAAAWRAIGNAAAVADGVGVPGSGLVAFGAFTFAPDSAAESVLVVPRHVVGDRAGVAFATDITGPASADPAPRTPSRSAATGLSAEGYVAAVRRAVERIEAGDLEKVVLARDVVLDAPVALQPALERLRERYADAWVFAVDGFFGASPETLVTVLGGAMTSRVLAGTAERGASGDADEAARRTLLESPKNRFEHALAVDSLLLTLEDRVQGLTLGRPFALGLPNVWHLATDATGGVAASVGALDLVALLHPTAAVAGAPRDAALAVIARLEPFDRRRYAGPVGWIDAAGDGEWAIGLRSAETEAPGRVRAYAGAGIVGESVAEDELAETGWKLAPILEALGLPSASPLSAAAGLPAGSGRSAAR